MLSMDALWLEDGRLSLRRIDRPEPAPDEALVRVLQAGICNTDLELVDGYYPFAGVLGHEFVGRVEAGPETLRGRRVVGEINVPCGECGECGAGRRRHCERREVLGIQGRHGAFAEYLTLPVDNLHPVPESLPSDRAVFTEPLAAALRIQQQIEIGPGTRVLIAGVGKLGLLIARSLVPTGCRLTALGRRTEPLAALRRQGIETVTADAIQPRRFDIAIECTGNPDGFELACRALRPRGTLVLKSTYQGDLTFDVAPLVVDEITLVGSRCGPFAPALERLARGSIEIDDLIEARYPLAEAYAAFEHAARPGALKVLLDISDPG